MNISHTIKYIRKKLSKLSKIYDDILPDGTLTKNGVRLKTESFVYQLAAIFEFDEEFVRYTKANAKDWEKIGLIDNAKIPIYGNKGYKIL